MPKYEYQAGGSLAPDAPSYIKRQADEDFYQGLKKGDFCYVLNARQMGKSSLRVRTIQRLRAEGCACASIDVTEIGETDTTLEQWYSGIIDIIAETVGLTDFDLDEWWESHQRLSPVHHLGKFFEEVLLVQVQQPIVIFVDESDAMSRFGEDFFALIRSCYNKRPDNPAYERLTFAILGVVSPSDLIVDKKRTPFNIGRAIDLTGFEFHEAVSLAQGLAVPDPKRVLQIILDWTGGQPFLTQKLCRLISKENTSISTGEETAWIADWIQRHIINHWETQDEPTHLRHIRDRILYEGGQQTGRLLGLYQKLLQCGELPADDSREQVTLRFSGLVVRRGDKLLIYNRIYAKIFDLDWVERALAGLRPYAESFKAWVASGYQDESRLLQGQALEEAQTWAKGKSLSDADHNFLAASREQTLKAEMTESIKKQRDIALDAISKRTYKWIDELVKIPRTQEIVAEILTDNTALLDQIYDLAPDVREAQREKGVNLNLVGNAWLLLGNTEKALQAYEQDLEISKKLAKDDPNSFQAQRDVAVSFEKIGDVQLQLGNTEKTLQAYQQSLEIFEKLAKDDPNSFQAQRSLLVSYYKLGRIQTNLQKPAAARQYYQQALAIAEELAAQDPLNQTAQNDLRVLRGLVPLSTTD